ncbi:MAG: response regulator [Bacteroidota bacterium]|nr:response regulator [Candidatus Kapabacteria bacterium]MDW8220001.1 response regulator [Bacteroidota bacterium]
MALTAFVASTSKLLSKFVQDVCIAKDINVVQMRNEQTLFAELQASTPDLLFLHASIIEEHDDNIIARIKADDHLSRAYIVVFASRPEGAEFAYKVGADAFLPIPFTNEQFEQILRLILNLPKHLLVVSKTEVLPNTVREAGAMYDFSVRWARTADEALQIAGETFPDLILSEYALPGRNGAELSKNVKSSHLLGHIPVVLIMESNDEELVEQCFEAGSNDVFLFPFDRQKHITLISNIVKPPRKGRKYSALVVDDSITIRHVISKMFKQMGFTVLTAANGQEGMKLAIQHRPDIITSDYDMPVMDGWEFCARLRESEFTNDIPVVMVSSRDTARDKRKAQALGVAAYLTKPFKTEDLEKVVKALVIQAQRRRKEEILEKYASSDALKTIGDGASAVMQERTVTIFSSNICNFGKKFDWLGTERTLEVLNHYFHVVISTLIKHEGSVDAIMGDEILARFDTGEPSTDALNAVDAAVALLEYFDAYNSREEDELEIRIGIHSDCMLVGNFGSPEHRLVYSMLGDGVNVAKLLQRATAPNTCLLSSETYAYVKESVGDLPSYAVPRRGGERDIIAYKL